MPASDQQRRLSGYLRRGTLFEMASTSNRRRQRTRQRLLAAALASAALLVVAAACGISFGSTTDETEMFKNLRVEGDFRLGGELRLLLDIEQPYAVDIAGVCELLDADATPTTTAEPDATPTPVRIPPAAPTPTNRVGVLFDGPIAANPAGGVVDEATPVVEPVEVLFRAPERAGRYRVRCYTPADDTNEVSVTFTVEPFLAP